MGKKEIELATERGCSLRVEFERERSLQKGERKRDDTMRYDMREKQQEENLELISSNR